MCKVFHSSKHPQGLTTLYTGPQLIALTPDDFSNDLGLITR